MPHTTTGRTSMYPTNVQSIKPISPVGQSGLNYQVAGTWDTLEPNEQPRNTLPTVAPRPDLKTLTDPKIDSRVVEAVERLGGKVTVADVASSAGVDLQIAAINVRDMAYLTGAAIIVSESGELLYDFGRRPSARLASVSARASLSQAWKKISPYLAKGIRIAFGLALFASLATVFVTLTLVNGVFSLTSEEDEERGGGGSSGGGFFHPHSFFGPSIWIMPQPYYSYGYYDPYAGAEYYEERPQRKMSFFEAVYSFVFGDGNPNYRLDERRYQMIAQVIRDNDGAVVAEQLAPYLEPPESWFQRSPDSVVVDEAFVGPVLTRFNGHAEVTDQGDIVYVFDDLRSTSGKSRGHSAVSSFLEEEETTFSRATTGQKWMAAILGGINVFGAVKLGSIVSVLSILTAKKVITLGPFLTAVTGLYPFLCAYAAVFVATPVLRWFVMQGTNAGVSNRNEARYAAAVQLQNGLRASGSDTRRKIEGSMQFKGAARNIGNESIAFRSDVDATSQKEDEFAAFDRKLGTA
uniref:Uncharacterized protein n=1 Tax=Eutreptiella gymnastica TaxID=73025 RepID=A0A7S1I3A1_9EUGL